MNSDKEPVSLTITATFSAPIPPTIQAGFIRPNFDVGTGGSPIYWATQNAAKVYVTCSGFNWGPGYVGLQGNPSGVIMDITYTGTISCTFTATNEVGQTASATATANVTRPPPPWVNAGYSPANIVAGQQSQLLYDSGNATVIGLVCNGLQFVAVQTPSMILNQPWYWFAQTWPNPGTQSCNIHAHNSLGEVAVVTFDLVVAPAGFAPSGGGTSGMTVMDPSNPGAPLPSGPSAGSGHPQGYLNPATGVITSDPQGNNPCGNCATGAGMQVNVSGGEPTSAPATGNDTSTTSSTSP